MKTGIRPAVLLATALAISINPGRNFGAESFRSPTAPGNFNPQPPANADGPWNRDVIVYHAGANGRVEKLATFERAGVPTLARMKDGRLMAANQHFPADDAAGFDKVAVRFSADEGRSWTRPQVIQLDGLPEGMRFPFDPTLVPLPDGRVRLYFTGNMGRTFEQSTPAIHSAISTDGVSYAYEPGARFAVEGRAVIDCAVVLHQGVFHLYAPDNGVGPNPGRDRANEPTADRPRSGVGYHATSRDGLNFTRQQNVQIDSRRRWLGNAQSDGRQITFFGTGDPGPRTPGQPRGSLWMATSTDGQAWQPVNSPVVFGGDPGAVASQNGGLVIVITGEPRPGTPGARMNRPSPRADNREEEPSDPGPRDNRPLDLNMMWSQGRATGKGTVRLKTFPLRLDDLDHINPMGMMASGHTTPSDHLYLVAKASPDPRELYDVLAVADGYVVSIQWRPNPPGGQPDPTVFDRAVDLKVVLEHAATCWSYVDHLVALDPALQEQVGRELQPGQPVPVRIPVKAGQVIGKVRGGFTFDFALIDTTVTLKGFVRPEQFYRRDPWKPHTVDPFDYLDEPLRSMLLLFNPRQTPPFGGKIDHDIDGKIVGNWYEAGTGGYAGLNRRWDYWVGHLAFAYHHIDPSRVMISIGNYAGQARQFWVKGNAPDPTKVGERDGPVKYELLWGQLGNSRQPQVRHDAEVVQGVALAQVLPGRKLKFESFPEKTADEVKGFTSAAKIYER